MAHASLLDQHQFCSISNSYLEGRKKHHCTAVTPAACPGSKEQPVLQGKRKSSKGGKKGVKKQTMKTLHKHFCPRTINN